MLGRPVTTQLSGKPGFFISTHPNPSLHPHFPACRTSSCTLDSCTRLDPIPAGPYERDHSRNCSAGWFWVGMQTKAPWVGAAFPETDYLQLLPASSPWRWIILLR